MECIFNMCIKKWLLSYCQFNIYFVYWVTVVAIIYNLFFFSIVIVFRIKICTRFFFHKKHFKFKYLYNVLHVYDSIASYVEMCANVPVLSFANFLWFFPYFFFEGGRCQWAFFFKNITLSILVYLLLQSLYNTLVIIDDGQCYEQYVLPVDKNKIYMYMY